MKIVELARKRQIRADSANGASVQLPPEAQEWWGWKSGNPVRWFADLDKKELILRLDVPEDQKPAAPAPEAAS